VVLALGDAKEAELDKNTDMIAELMTILQTQPDRGTDDDELCPFGKTACFGAGGCGWVRGWPNGGPPLQELAHATTRSSPPWPSGQSRRALPALAKKQVRPPHRMWAPSRASGRSPPKGSWGRPVAYQLSLTAPGLFQRGGPPPSLGNDFRQGRCAHPTAPPSPTRRRV
jgi:hypothetical protein